MVWSVVGENLFPDPEFKDTELWTRSPEYALIKLPDGTSALQVERHDAKEYRFASYKMKLTPGRYYRFGCKAKIEKGHPMIGMEYRTDGKFANGTYGFLEGSSTDFSETAEYFYLPPEADPDVSFLFFLPRDNTGKAWCKDIFIEPMKDAYLAYLVAPAFPGRIVAGENRLCLAIANLDGKIPAGLRVRVCYYDDDKICRAETDAPVTNGRVVCTLRLTPASHGYLDITAIAGTKELSLEPIAIQVNPKPLPVNKNTVEIDAKGRLLVGGKKFFPVGIYTFEQSTHPAEWTFEKTVETLAAAGFNTVLPYDICYWGNLIGPRLETYANNRIKVIFPLATGNYTSLVRRWKDNPAVLAWSLRDEPTPGTHDEMVRRRDTVHRLDQQHPTYIVFCGLHEKFAPFLGGMTDIVAVDVYPVGGKPPYSLKHIRDNIELLKKLFAGDGCFSFLMVPQIFNWRAYPTSELIRKFPTSPDPTEKEMRSMQIDALIAGAKGIIMYSWFDLQKPEVSGNFANRWPDIVRVTALTKKLGAFVLGDPAPPKFGMRIHSGEVVARGFTADDGRQAILIAAAGPGKSEAIFSLPPGEWQSECGNTGKESSGKWRFSGQDIDSDVLWKKP